MKSLRAALLALCYLLLAILGTPGLDYVEDLSAARVAQLAQSDNPLAILPIQLRAWDINWRRPLTKLLEPLQRPFRISQNWSLYRDGPYRVERLEILIDDQLVYRSVDPNYTWMEAQLRNRRLRPMVESTVQKTNSQNWLGLSRFIQHHALLDFPQCQHIVLRAMHSPFPGDQPTEHHRIQMNAPDWTPQLTQEKQDD